MSVLPGRVLLRKAGQPIGELDQLRCVPFCWVFIRGRRGRRSPARRATGSKSEEALLYLADRSAKPGDFEHSAELIHHASAVDLSKATWYNSQAHYLSALGRFGEAMPGNHVVTHPTPARTMMTRRHQSERSSNT